MVTYPVEKAVSTVNGVNYVSSISRQGASLVTINFNWGTNLDTAQSDVLQAVNLIHGDLPKECQYPDHPKIRRLPDIGRLHCSHGRGAQRGAIV